MVIFILSIILLPLAQQTSHTHGPWDSDWQGLLLTPQKSPSVTFSPQIPDFTPAATPTALLHAHKAFYFCLCAPPQQLRPHRDQGDRVRRTDGKHGSRAGRKIDRKTEKDSELERHNMHSREKVT